MTSPLQLKRSDLQKISDYIVAESVTMVILVNINKTEVQHIGLEKTDAI